MEKIDLIFALEEKVKALDKLLTSQLHLNENMVSLLHDLTDRIIELEKKAFSKGGE